MTDVTATTKHPLQQRMMALQQRSMHCNNETYHCNIEAEINRPLTRSIDSKDLSSHELLPRRPSVYVIHINIYISILFSHPWITISRKPPKLRSPQFDRKKPPLLGVFPIYYGPSSRTVSKRTPLEEFVPGSSRGFLLLTVLDEGT